jgi:hypothetical protein
MFSKEGLTGLLASFDEIDESVDYQIFVCQLFANIDKLVQEVWHISDLYEQRRIEWSSYITQKLEEDHQLEQYEHEIKNCKRDHFDTKLKCKSVNRKYNELVDDSEKLKFVFISEQEKHPKY